MWDFMVSGAHRMASSMMPLQRWAKSLTICSLSDWVSFSMMVWPVAWPTWITGDSMFGFSWGLLVSKKVFQLLFLIIFHHSTFLFLCSFAHFHVRH